MPLGEVSYFYRLSDVIKIIKDFIKYLLYNKKFYYICQTNDKQNDKILYRKRINKRIFYNH